ncbi:hypothetical protein [Chitinimonas sp.]|uniref:hypothetical protein n=1 Tax=Chitinimonas sp. TaxID=1934313 RepID=UPI002F93BACB
MNLMRVIAIALIIAGTLALSYGGFSYTKESEAAKLGPIELTFKKQEQVVIPTWAGVAAIAAGVGLLLLGSRKR